MSNSTRIRFFGASVLLLAGCCVAAFAQSAPNRVHSAINENEVVTLSGNVHPMARAEFDQGAVSAAMRLDKMVLQLTPAASQQAELEALVEAQHDLQSPLYHQWLTPAQYGARFGASASDLAQVTAWLAAHGFQVEEISANNSQIVFSGTAGQVAEAFHTEIHSYQVNGVTHIANAQDPQIPAALAGVVGGVVSLHDFRRNSAIHTRTSLGIPAASGVLPQDTSGSTHYLFPADWATIYDLNSLYKAGTNGTATSIAIVGRSNINVNDVTTFRTASALSTNNPSVILVNTNPGLVSGDQDESTLDVEWAGAVAPSATVKFVVAASTNTSDGVDLSAQYIVNHVTAPIMSTSYGSCEADMGSTELAFYNSLWQQAASEGISAFVSSGDSGAAGCYSGSATKASGTGVNGLCSSPYSTCVGGTEFNEGSSTAYWSTSNGTGNESALSYIPEKVWNESASVSGGSGLWASGGGASIIYSQPTWQKGISGISAANGMRAVPDVAMTAAGHDGYIIVENGSYYVIAGTSAASPSFAGVMALVVQSKSGVGQGNANTGLYSLLNASKNPFHATPSGNNSVPGVTGFTASGASYNLATGLGSVDGAVLVSSWGTGSSTSTTDFALKASATSGTVLTGKTTTFTLNVTESGTAANSVALTATAPTGVTVSISPTSITPSTTATVTVTVAATATAGAQNIVITGKDTSGTQTVTYALTVTQPPALALTAASASASVVQGSTTSDVLTATTGGSFTGNITYSITGLPTGVTASWTANSVTTASGSNTETLTLTAASSTAITKAATLTVTAAGDGLTASQTITLAVTAAPTLTVTPASTSLNLTQGKTVTDVFTFAGSSTFTGAVTFSVSGLPTGVTAAWSSSSSTVSNAAGSSTLTLSATSAANLGAATLTVTATGDGLTVSKTIALTVVAAPSLTVTAASTSLSVTQGKTTTDVISLAGNSTYSGAVTLSVSGLPTGVTASWSSSSVTLSGEAGSATLTLTASSTAAITAAASTVTVTATGDGLTVSKTITLAVTAAPTLAVTPASSTLSIIQGKTLTDVISLAGNSTYSGAVSLSVAALPTGVTAAWSSSPVTLANEAGSSTLTLTATATATIASSATVTVTATGDGLTVSKTITLAVTAAPTLTATPTSTALTVMQGKTVTDVVSLSGNSAFSGAVALTVTGLPTGVTASWSSTSATLANAAGSSTLTLTATSTATVGSSTLTVTATGDGLTVSKTITLAVTAAPTLTATPASTSLSMMQGKTITDVFTLVGNSAYTGSVSFTVSGLPAGVTASWSSTSATLTNAAGSSTLTLTAASTATVGSATLTVTATGDGLTVSKTITMAVTAAPTLTATPASTALSLTPGKTVTEVFTLAGNSTYAGAVALSVTGLPTGVTASWSSSSATLSNETGSSTLTLTASSTAKASSSIITVTVVGDGLTLTKTISLSVL
jgi:subtilase family serine protease